MMRIRTIAVLLSVCLSPAVALAAEEIKHAFLATGGETFIVDENGKTVWKYTQSSRDGWVLPNGNVLLALSKSKAFPGGGVAEVDRDGSTLFEYKGSQAEVNTVQPLTDGRVLLTEAGDKPRLVEVDRTGKILVVVPLQAQIKDHHLQTRMARKLANGRAGANEGCARTQPR